MAATTGVWHRQGEMWIVGLAADRTPLRDSKGLRHIQHLLERPDQEVSALDLVGAVEGHGAGSGEAVQPELSVGGAGDAGSVLDSKAKTEYRQRLSELQAEIEEADRFHDPERASNARMELEFLTKELSSAVGLGGRDRKVGAASERARVNVTRSIKSVVDRIAEHDQGLAVHLRGTLRTGTYCSYAPPSGDRVDWDFTGDATGQAPAAPAPTRPARARVAASPTGAIDALVEREAELALIDTALERAGAGGGGAIVLEGPPGIGKSALSAAAAQRAGERGFEVVRARATELEAHVPFAVVRQLFEPVLRAQDDERLATLLRGAVTPAAAMLGYGDPEAEAADKANPFDVHNGLYWLCSALTEEGPLVVVADDVQWADEQTVGWLEFMAARVAELPLLLVIAHRTTISGEPTAQLVPLVGRPDVQVITPSVLSDEAVTALVRTAWPEPSDEFCRACHAASGGNPFYLREIVVAAKAAGVAPTAEGAERLADLTPESVTRLVLSRLRRVGDAGEALARACAVLGPHAELAAAAHLAEIDADESLGVADALAEAGVIRARRPLEFMHPLIKAVIEQEIPLGVRSVLHERAAALLSERHAPASDVAVHLLQSRPTGSLDAVECLRQAARQALADGAPESAARFLERALAEPPRDRALPEVLLELARVHERRGRYDDAVPHLRTAMAATDDPVLLAEIVLELSRSPGGGDLRSRIAALDQAIAAVEDLDRELRFRLEAQAIELLGDAIAVTASPHVKREHDERLERVAQMADRGTSGERQLLAIYAVQKTVAGDITADEARSLALRALDDGVLMRRLAEGAWSCDSAVEVLSMTDAFDLADRHAREAEMHARERGLTGSEAYACMLRAMVALHRGALLDSDALLRSVFAILRHTPDPYVESAANQITAIGSIERGDLASAEEACQMLTRESFTPMGTPHVLGKLHLARGEHELAVAELRAAFTMQRNAGIWRRTMLNAIGPDLVMSLAAAGEREEAATLAAEELEIARRFGAPSAIASALRALGHVEHEQALDHLAEAARILASSQAVLLRAHVLCDLGAAQRRGGAIPAAQATLQSALQLADHAGAGALAENIHIELARAGLRAERAAPAGAELLSAGERRVALLAAEGATDRDIAQSLFLQVREVEAQLTTACEKLGVASRDELADALTPELVAA